MNRLPKDGAVIEITAPGPPEVLKLARRPVVPPGAGEVLIRVAAAGVNRPDVHQRQGNYPPPPGASDIPGLEVAGEIVAVGDAVAEWRARDFVCALVAGGGYAEYCLAPAPQCLPGPKGLSAVRRLFGYTCDNEGSADIGENDHAQLMGRVFVNAIRRYF